MEIVSLVTARMPLNTESSSDRKAPVLADKTRASTLCSIAMAASDCCANCDRDPALSSSNCEMLSSKTLVMKHLHFRRCTRGSCHSISCSASNSSPVFCSNGSIMS